MIKSVPLFGIAFFALLLSCTESQKDESSNKYILKGTVSGFENNTWIYLARDGQEIDSAQIMDSTFEFEGDIVHPQDYELYVKTSQNFAPIWLEQGIINFNAKNGEFRNAEITGSKTQTEQERLNAIVKKYRSKRDSLSAASVNPEYNDSIRNMAKDSLQVIYANHLELEQEFIRNHPNSFVSAFLVDFYAVSLGKTTTQKLFDILSESIKTSNFGQNIDRYLTLNESLKIGDRYVNFSMTNEKGELISLSDYEGKVVLLDFWAPSCGPCIKEYPALKKAYSQFSHDDFEIISISEDQTREGWLTAVKENELDWVNLWQESGNKADPYLIYGVNGIPDNFLIDEHGIIVARDLRGNDLISAIEESLGETESR